MMKVKVLVTGATGFIGSGFIDLLKRRGVPYAAYDRARPDSIPDDVTVVVHCAGVTPHGAKIGSEKEFFDGNVRTTERLLAAVRNHPHITRVINVGSAAEYGFSSRVITEASHPRPSDIYGKSKLAQTQVMERFARESGIPVINVRVFNLIAVRHRWPEGFRRLFLFEALVRQLDEGGSVVRVRNPKDVRDFLDPSDVYEALYAALTAECKGYTLINICSGIGLAIADVAHACAKVLGRSVQVVGEGKNPTRSIGSCEKARRVLGWEPHISLEESVRHIIGKRKRVLVVGAGAAGKAVAVEVERERRFDVLIVGFVDDDVDKQGLTIGGVSVLGTIADIAALVRREAVDYVLVSIPSVGGDMALRVARLLPPGFPIKVLPSVASVILGRVDLSYVRDVDPSDLLGRPLVRADQYRIAKAAAGKKFLVTGGAGSIGSEIVRQLHASSAKEIIVVDSWEEGVFNLMQEIAQKDSDAKRMRAFIGSVRDKKRLQEIMKAHRPDVVIHAAAYKHVPLMEANPEEADKTNRLGTKHVLEVCVEYGVRDFVLISTDKAVHPTSVMGKSKRAAELLVQKYAQMHPHMRACSVRFGNVLNSSGSIVPLFLAQIRARMPVTITHPDMTRYFMSIPEAVSLVLTAWIIAKRGQILVLDMGEPVKIVDLAEHLIRLHGLEPRRDIEIQFTGIRPGEKIHEELSYDPASVRASTAARIRIAEEL